MTQLLLSVFSRDAKASKQHDLVLQQVVEMLFSRAQLKSLKYTEQRDSIPRARKSKLIID